MRRWLTIFLAGALGGTLLDQLHVLGHVLSYPHPSVAGEAWWVAPQFGIAAIVIVLSTQLHLRAWRVQADAGIGRVLAIDATWFVVAYAVTATWGRDDLGATAAALGAAWLLRMALTSRPLPVLALAVALGVCGTGYEVLLTSVGAFHYAHSTAGGVPAWLPFLYMHGAWLACSLVAALDQPPVVTAARRDAMLDSSSR